MCGIFGLVHKTGALDAEALRQGTQRAAHRGPDGHGLFIHGNLGLGHTRLAILDTATTGAQPMRHATLPLVITFNGEIYNYLELRAELKGAGHAFHTGTDTEVLLAAYAQWGEACLSRLNGMWAFAIFDGRDNTLFCARDRFGVKPFYYHDSPTQFAFGSEIRQLLPFLHNRYADPELIEDFLVCGLTDHSARTFFRGIQKLPPGHWLRVSLDDVSVQARPFYRLTPNESARALDPHAATARLRELLDDATRLRLRSDVSVGTCLSGGLDSSSVATLAARAHAGRSAQAFCAITAISEQASNSEEVYAEQVARTAGLNWIIVTPTYRDFADTLDDVIHTQEEPFGGPSISMQYFVMRTAREHGIKVLLDGQGGDETLLGYERYYPAWLLDAYRRLGPGGFMRAVREATQHNANTPLPRLMMYLLGVGSARARQAAYRLRYRFLRRARLPEALVRFSANARDWAAMQHQEITETNLPMLLRFEDKNSMRFGVEARLPFLDYRLVEFALGLPLAVKLREGWTKWPLRAAMSDTLPDTIAWRRNKFGFNAPDALWLEQHADIMREHTLQSEMVREFIDPARLSRAYHQTDRTMRWRLFCLARWAAIFGVSPT